MTAVIDKPSRTKAAAKPVTVGSSIDKLWQLREEKRAADAIVAKIEEAIKAQEEVVFESLDAQGLKKGDGAKASVSIGESVIASVTDWDALWTYIAKTKNFQLVQKRVSDLAWRELMGLSKGKGVPGTESFTKKKLTLRSLSSTV